MLESYRLRYEDLYQRHWWWRVRADLIERELDRLHPKAGWKRILDVGCGNGLFFDRLRRFGKVEGVEPETALLDPSGRWYDAIQAVPFDTHYRPAHRYDVILMLDVLEHMAEPAAALRHAVSLLEPGGFAVITVPAFNWLWTRHDELNEHVQRFNRKSFRQLANSAGLRIIREAYLFQWLVPAKLLIRARERLGRGAPQPPTVPPRPINWLLTALSRAEAAVCAPLGLPFGSSLLISGTAGEA